MCKMKVSLILLMIFASVVRSASDENLIVDATESVVHLATKNDTIENSIFVSDSFTLSYDTKTKELGESALSGDYTDTTESLDAISTNDYSIDSDTTTESITTESDDTTTEIIETTTNDPLDDCQIVSMNHNVNDTNHLTVSWTINGTSCNSNTTINMNLLDIVCQDNCRALNTGSDCYNSCSQMRNSSESPFTFFYPLQPCRNYLLTYALINSPNVQNINLQGKYKYSSVENLKAQDIIAGDIDNNSSMLNILLTWSYRYTDCEQEFEVEIINERSFRTSFYNYTIANVTACSDYKIQVYPRILDSNGELFGQNVSLTTRRVDPSPIRDFNVSFPSPGNAIEVRWNPPIYGEKCIDFYEISVESEFESINWPPVNCCKEYITVNYSCVDYNVTLKTFSNDPDGTTTTIASAPLETTTSIVTTSMTSSSIGRNPNAKAEQETALHIRTEARPLSTSEINPTQSSKQTDTELYLFVEVNITRNKCEISQYAFQCNNSMNGNGSYELSLVPNVTLRNLLPDTDYNCSAKVLNEGGWSDEGFSTTFKTKEGKPNKPIIRNLIEGTNNFTIFWDEPTDPKGRIQNYQIYIKFLQFLYFNPDYCASSPNEKEFRVTIDGVQRNYTYSNAAAFSKYSISIQAHNENAGEWSEVSFLNTRQDLSGPVELFDVIDNEIDPNVEYNNTIEVTWLFPCNSNGDITDFVIFYHYNNLSESKVIPIAFNNDETNFTHPLELTPDTQYLIWVVARSGSLDGQNATWKSFTMAPGIPDASKITDISKDVFIRNSAKHYADLSLSPNLFKSSVGSIERIALLINQLDCGASMKRARDIIERDDIDTKPSWREAMEQSCIPQYYADDIHNPKVLSISKSHNSSSISFGIGKFVCDDQKPCDGSLKSGTKYALTLRLYTKSGFADSGYLEFITDSEIPLLAIILSFLVIMLIVFSIGFYITYKKPRKSHLAGQYDRKDVPIQNFEMHHKEMILNDNEKIREEYNAIQFFSDGLDKTMIASKVNEKCNRYANIAPFDYNRVVLNEDEFELDYINGSFINGYYYAKEFIATQGPKPTTAIDFWRMVLQYKTESIVMLTSLVENNKIKCHEYFPKLNGHVKFDNINILCTSEQKYLSYVKRILEVEKDDVKLKVKHYYFCKWPDHGACNSSDLIDFVKTVRLERERPSDTFIVHCSAGVGRTGTFIAVDILLQRIKQERKVNIYEIVKKLRKQRMKMVQSFDQYLLIYNAALELSTTRAKQPKVMHSITMYMENIELFKNWRRRGKLHDNNENDMKVIDKNESPL